MMSPVPDDPNTNAHLGVAGKAEEDSWRDLAQEPARPSQSEASSALALGRLSGVRVFIAAADPARRTALARTLQALGLGVEAGSPDESGYRHALGFHPDAVVSELTRPGEPGWWLLQRFRRHPLLRWTPVLLMRWWAEEGKGEPSDVLVSRVVENLAEALTPLRVIEERIAAGRPLGDRLELIGILPLLKVLGRTGLTGTLNINDGSNVFEIDLANGVPLRAVRRGMGDDETVGEMALFEAALCDFGRWTFKAHGAPPPAPNLAGSLDDAIRRIDGLAGLVFGPDAVYRDGADAAVEVRLDRLRDVASTSAGLARQLCEVLAVGASQEELGTLLKEGEDRLVVERTIISLMRCSAVSPLRPGAVAKLDPETARAAASAARVLAWLAAEHRLDPVAEDGERGAAPKTAVSTGYYQIAPRREERVALGAAEGIVAPGAWRPSMTADLGPSARRSIAADESTPAAHGTAQAQNVEASAGPRQGGALERDAGRHVAPLYDSLAPSPQGAVDGKQRGLWIALGLALLLGALLAAGLVLIGTSAREAPAAHTAPNR
jgi:hypothetical protein